VGAAGVKDMLRNTMRRCILMAMLFIASASGASATITVCSDPSRARVLDTLTLQILDRDEPAFATTIRRFDGVAGMMMSETGRISPDHIFRTRTLLFQSPEFSVVINVRTVLGRDHASVNIERTCINDALEEWEPYWRAFRQFLDREG